MKTFPRIMKIFLRIAAFVLLLPILLFGFFSVMIELYDPFDPDDTIARIIWVFFSLSLMGFTICSMICLVKYNKKLMISAIGLLLLGTTVPISNLFIERKVEFIHIVTSERKMYLCDEHSNITRTYTVSFDTDAVNKGDGRTLQGWYYIDAMNPDSITHKSLRIIPFDGHYAAMPNTVYTADEIRIHGTPNEGAPEKAVRMHRRDWTGVSFAVTNKEMNEIYRRVKVGIRVLIVPAKE